MSIAIEASLFFISTKVVHPNEILASFDVVFLFTQVPVQLAVTVARSRLTANDTLFPNKLVCSRYLSSKSLPQHRLNVLLWSIFSTTSCNGNGSPVSVLFANLVMEDVEESALASYDVELPF